MSADYKILDEIEHVLTRPHMYIGSVADITSQAYIVEKKESDYVGVYKDAIPYSHGLYKIIDEALTNAMDHTFRTMKNKDIDLCDLICINVEKDHVIISNNGKSIPIETKQIKLNGKQGDIYIPEMIFGHLRSGSNFNDSQQRLSGGVHGLGIKLCNILSTKFEIYIEDSKSNQTYSQIWTKNMSKCSAPKIKTPKNKLTKNKIEITFYPDFTRFGDGKSTEFSEDMQGLIRKRAYDLVMASPSGVQIKLDGKLIRKINDVKQYAAFFGLPDCYIIKNTNPLWSVGMIYNKDQLDNHTQLTYVNGVNTSDGGTHIMHLFNQVFTVVESMTKASGLTRRKLLTKITWVVFGTIYNPKFDTQTKLKLASPVKDWGMDVKLDESSIKTFINKSGILDEIQSDKQAEDQKQLAKTDGNKKRFVNISKASWDDAPLSGTARSSECKLFLVEGNSASSLFKNGKTAENAHTIGVYPLRGVPINSRIASLKDIAANDEFNDIKQILGLREKMVYTKDNIKTLRYGKLLIAADQDPDGGKIKMLIINHLERFWPSLFEIGFVSFFTTPLIRASTGKKVEIIEFFSQSQFDLWAKNKSLSAYKIKWLKGLASSDNNDAKRYMQNIMGNSKRIKLLEADKPFLEQMFGKDSDPRKDLLMNKLPTELDYTRSEYDVSELLHSEYLDYMFYSLKRAIPNMIDGLKDVNRKIVFSAKQLKQGVEMKVSNFASSVMEQTDYHHGPVSIEDAVANMSQCYTGANNFALLNSHSQNGSRMDSEHGASRYIFISKNKLIDMIFNNRDDPLLKWKDDVDQGIVKKMEPEFYCPILPYVLLNGNEGIAVGYSTSIPPFKPVDIIQWIFAYVSRPVGDDKLPSTGHFVPYYRGFIGKITRNAGQPSFSCSGCVERLGPCKYKISELLPEMTIAIFKAHLIKLVEKGIVLSYDNLSYEAENKDDASGLWPQ